MITGSKCRDKLELTEHITRTLMAYMVFCYMLAKWTRFCALLVEKISPTLVIEESVKVLQELKSHKK